MTADEKKISELFERVSSEMSPYRFAHTVGVERAALRLGELYLPDDLYELRVAALLHDITKELTVEEHLDILRVNGVEITENILRSPKTLHARTAEFEARRCFPEYATENVLSAVLKHTVLDPDMSLFDEIIYVADFIEENRTYTACIDMRDYVLSSVSDNISDNVMLIHRATLKIIDFTLDFIKRKNLFVIDKTLLAKEALERKIKQI